MATATVERQREMGRLGKDTSVRGALDKGAAEILNTISTAARNGR